MDFHEVLQLQVLKLKAMQSGVANRSLVDALLAQGEEVKGVRNMCAKVSNELYEELEQVCGLLSMSKREFIEGAVSESLARAQELISSTNALGQQGEL